LKILSTDEFREWLETLGAKNRTLVDSRLDRVRHFDHFGDSKSLGDGLSELRWKNGTRVYYSLVVLSDGRAALMLLGGDKNGQERDIAKARRVLEREIE
jgi:putative addiction module killer protein